MSLKLTRQLDGMDCGPACLKMILDYYGLNISLQKLRDLCHITREGVSMAGIIDAAERLNLRTLAVKLSLFSKNGNPGLEDFILPCIIHWEKQHFVVVYKITNKYVWVSDPAYGKLKFRIEQFCASWYSDNNKGFALGIEPTPEFYKLDTEIKSSNVWTGLFLYLSPYNRLIFQFMVGIFVGLIFQVMFPFLTQSLIDVGVQNHNLSFISLVLIAQMVLFISQIFVQFIQSWIILHIGKRVNVALISDFIVRLMRLPLGYFDSKNVGDLIQRIYDNERIENFLTGSLLNILFSFLSVIVFSIILLTFNALIFVIFFLFTITYVTWVMIFMKRRADLDFQTFRQVADNQSMLYEMINGMQEIKLQGSERKRRFLWMNIQALLFKIQSKALALRQYQDFGAIFLNRMKDIIITFIAAREVIHGQISLGTLFAIQYIVGQLNAPFDQFINFIRSAQDAHISLTRLSEITDITPEENNQIQTISEIPMHNSLILDNVGFAYSPLSPKVLKSINFSIPKGKITAIVGSSGSGKTTLLKLLLGFYPPTEGKISIGDTPLQAINKSVWRSKCGTVLQDGYIFSDTISNNIIGSSDSINITKFDRSLSVANIHTFVYSLPLSYKTMIGSKGIGISQGQRQRILIARAVYKDPEYLFLTKPQMPWMPPTNASSWKISISFSKAKQ